MDQWDICREFVTLRERIFRLQESLEQYGYDDSVSELKAIDAKIRELSRDVNKFFEPDPDDD